MPTAKKHARRGRRPLSQRAHARGVDVKSVRGRATRAERVREHEGRKLAPTPASPGGKGESARKRRARVARARSLFR